MENSAFSFISTSCNGDNQGMINGASYAEKKLRLFGIELQISQDSHKKIMLNDNIVVECDESVYSSSSSTVSSSGGVEKISKESPSTTDIAAPPTQEEINKFVCQYCLKRFPNSQALGGHQNAHKKERMRKKRLQLQARKASINCYLQPFKNNPSFNYHISSPCLSDPTNIQAQEFTMYDEAQISFSHSDQDRWYMPLEKDSNMFTLTHLDRHRDANPQVRVKASPFPSSMKNPKALDLQLGLSF